MLPLHYVIIIQIVNKKILHYQNWKRPRDKAIVLIFWKTETEKKPNQTVFYKQILQPNQPKSICCKFIPAFENFKHIKHPDQMIKYKHALMLYKLLRQCTPNDEFIQLNFKAKLNRRLQHYNFLKVQNYSVGNNILLNRMCCLNNIIPYSMTNESYLSYKIKCKNLFLKI